MIKKTVSCVKNCIRYIITRIKMGKNLQTNNFFRMGKDCDFVSSQNGKITLGSKVEFSKRNTIGAVEGNIHIGSNIFFNENCIIVARDRIEIGDNCIFGPGVTIYDHDHVFDCDGIKEDYKTGPVIIDCGCWIGANVTILRNTHIGEGCVIGAGTIIKGEIPSHSRVTGSPNIVKTIV